MNLRSGHQLQVLQVRVEQAAAGQRNPQNRLDDVADGAVVGQADLLRRVHEVPATGKDQEDKINIRPNFLSPPVFVLKRRLVFG